MTSNTRNLAVTVSSHERKLGKKLEAKGEEIELNLLSFVQREGNLSELIKVKRENLYVKYSNSHYHTFLREGSYHKYSREMIQEIN